MHLHFQHVWVLHHHLCGINSCCQSNSGEGHRCFETISGNQPLKSNKTLLRAHRFRSSDLTIRNQNLVKWARVLMYSKSGVGDILFFGRGSACQCDILYLRIHLHQRKPKIDCAGALSEIQNTRLKNTVGTTFGSHPKKLYDQNLHVKLKTGIAIPYHAHLTRVRYFLVLENSINKKSYFTKSFKPIFQEIYANFSQSTHKVFQSTQGSHILTWGCSHWRCLVFTSPFSSRRAASRLCGQAQHACPQ